MFVAEQAKKRKYGANLDEDLFIAMQTTMTNHAQEYDDLPNQRKLVYEERARHELDSNHDYCRYDFRT